MQSTQQSPGRSSRIGPDLVVEHDGYVVIHARRVWPDWQVREFAPTPIYFRGNKYFLRQKAPADRPYAARYLLLPWPAGMQASGSSFFTYDEETVARRGADALAEYGATIVRCILLPFYPILGLLWSETQQKLVRFGFVPRSISAVSIFLTFVAALMQSALTGINLWAQQVTIWDFVLVIVLLADCVMRYGHYLKDTEMPCGFLEWLKPATPARTQRRRVASSHGVENGSDRPM